MPRSYHGMFARVEDLETQVDAVIFSECFKVIFPDENFLD
jgi:hypothetical protein